MACGRPGSYAPPPPVSHLNHPFFPLTTSSHGPDCAGCHTDRETFATFSCTGCHAGRSGFDLLHAQVSGYTYASDACYRCHQSPAPRVYRHAGIGGSCAPCHDVGQAFAALPVKTLAHRATDGADCGACHRTSGWRALAAPAGLVRDPARDVTVNALVPTYAGGSVDRVDLSVQQLPMSMDHGAAALPPATAADCGACHPATGSLYPGELHAALDRLGVPQPDRCAGCHAASAPAGFVGPLDTTTRTPPSGEMKHDAVAWSAGAPTTIAAVAADCAVCHVSPAGGLAATWVSGRAGAARAAFHPSLAAAALAQPASCLDCHASSRPVARLASGTAALPAGVTFDHAAAGALGDCATCHDAAATAGGASWSGGRWHLAGAATPPSCLPCHEGERPTSAAGWRGTTLARAPFDPGTNAAGVTHGGGQDCVVCHAGPGTGGAWGSSQSWVGGSFSHGPATVAGTTCSACHLSQRPDLQPGTTPAAMAALLGFDHALSGTGDCISCHRATVTRGRYATYVDPATGTVPGGDWAGGTGYPGATLVLDPGAVFTVTEHALVRTGALVTGWTARTATLRNPMSHVSPAIPAAIAPGPVTAPDLGGCWRCHTSTGTVVTSWANGRFHAALAGYRATPGGAVTPLPQPATCGDCHAPSLPSDVVELAASALRPMDHGAQFVSTVTIGGAAVSGVGGLDCGACHGSPGVRWADGLFHASIGAAAPQDCTVCHYPLMASPAADTASGTRYAMRHRSAAITEQRCELCHPAALGQSRTLPADPALWVPGFFHASAATPPACLECHPGTRPEAILTSGSAALPAGLTFDHAAPAARGECASCHVAGGTWSGGRWHLAGSVTPGTCLPCHAGERPTSTAGWRSATYTASPFDYGGNAGGVTHGGGLDCAGCHAGPGAGGAWGGTQSWVGGTFSHGPATAAATTCSACHLSQRPDLQPGADPQAVARLLGFDHAASGTGDCFGCHQATVTVGRYVDFLNPATGALPGGDWAGGAFYPGAALVFSPGAVFPVTALTLARAGPLVTGFTARTEVLVGAMSHVSPEIPPAVSPGPAESPDATGCWRCHTNAGGQVTTYANGRFHLSLAGYRATPGAAITALPQPTACADCHALSLPTGIVELSGAALQPMDHGALFATTVTIGGAAVSGVAGVDCAVCHVSPGVTWADGLFHARIGAAVPRDCTACHYPLMATAAADVGAGTRYAMQHRSTAVTDQRCERCHAGALARGAAVPISAALWQPGVLHSTVVALPASCLECHPTTRPAGVLGAQDASLPPGVTFDHAAAPGGATCATCHGAGTTWTGGRFHLAGSASPASCVPCHEGERPVSTAGWRSPTWAVSPFDYVGAAARAGHGAGQDCAVCHAGPGTGAWGGTQDWVGGSFSHGPATVAAVTCLLCHRTQRPDLQPGADPQAVARLLGFDHALNGTTDCLGCHRATVARGRFVDFVNPATGALPGGDWSGGVAYPGGGVLFDPGSSFTIVEISLTRAGTLVTGTTSKVATHYAGMSHVSPAIPPAMSPGPAAAPDPTTCWHCHENTKGTVIAYAGGTYHRALDAYAVTPGADATPLPQPGTGCGDCHVPSRPDAIVEGGGGALEPMDHAALFATPVVVGSATVTGVVDLDCSACHASPGSKWSDGVFHASVARLPGATPQDCTVCHFPLLASAAADVASGTRYAMAHRSPSITDQRCERCHAAALGLAASVPRTVLLWRPGAFHASVAGPPAACLDCHPGARPATALTSTTAALPPGVTFDHGAPGGAGDCAPCHAPGAAAGGWKAWAGGRWHLAGSATPATCLPCHAGERPTTSAGWLSSTYAVAPFDYGGNSAGVTHGAGEDCALCHAGPGTGAWGGAPTWIGGAFAHGPGTVAATTCIPCHVSQRPDLQPGATAPGMAALLGFDHARDGTGDCFGCHGATVARGRYGSYLDPATGRLPGGDWSGGVSYPGAALVYALASARPVTEVTLTRSGALVTGASSRAATVYGAMSHASPAIPAAIGPGPAASPDPAACWRCHASTGGAVTAYAGGRFHAALTAYSATPGGPVTPLAQPASGCADCHPPSSAASTPDGIVEGASSALRGMDHAALFSTVVTIGGATVAGVAGLDCSACHVSPGTTWADGLFHARIGTAAPRECVGCHYPLMASADADVASGTRYVMAHRSPVIDDQRCDRCHPGALARAATAPAAAALWRPGAYHASVVAQPAACSDCHRVTTPPSATPSTFVYAFGGGGGTATNGVQWMSHAAPGVSGADCAACHAADAQPTGGAWRRTTPFHAQVTQPAGCAGCHGVANGNGAVAGEGNNLPSGLVDASTLTTVSNDPATGVPPGTHDQIDHGDLSVSAHDCGFCHLQAGPSASAGVAGREWALARFHASFSAASPLVTNGTTSRCSRCHLNLAPGPSFTRFSHAAFTDAPPSQDCGQCHAWPGTGTAAAPNWLGGGSAPQYITVGGFLVPSPPAPAPAVQAGIPDLVHPDRSGGGCIVCHATGGAGGRGARGYDHGSPLVAGRCAACHEAGSDLVAAGWNGATDPSAGAGDTRPISLRDAAASYKGNTRVITSPDHFFLDRAGAPVDCSWCHGVSPGVSLATTGAAYRGAWAFTHPPELAPPVDLCYQCHVLGRPAGP